MLRGLYSSAAGMLGQIDRQDAIANNLANVNTSGYKRKAITFTGFNTELRNALQPAQSNDLRNVVPVPQTYEDTKQGGFQETGSKTSLALDGPGFFVIQTDNGDQFVRAGDFQLDGQGRIVNRDGFPVLGERGQIQVNGSDWHIDSEGNVISGGAAVDRIRIEKSAMDASKPTKVIQGSLETSNVNTVEEMVSMITALRSYEACQKSIQSLDQSLDKLINQMGK